MNQQIILGTPFLTQIYPFKLCNQGIKTKIFGWEIIFKFILSFRPLEINNFQNKSIYKLIFVIKKRNTYHL
jgi:hypothetical protein